MIQYGSDTVFVGCDYGQGDETIVSLLKQQQGRIIFIKSRRVGISEAFRRHVEERMDSTMKPIEEKPKFTGTPPKQFGMSLSKKRRRIR